MKVKLLKKIRARFKYAFLSPEHCVGDARPIKPEWTKGAYKWLDKKTTGEGTHYVAFSGCDYYNNGTRITQPSFAEVLTIAILGIYPVAKHRKRVLKKKASSIKKHGFVFRDDEEIRKAQIKGYTYLIP